MLAYPVGLSKSKTYCRFSSELRTQMEENTRRTKKRPPAAPAVPAVGGPPVGLGGPGNLAALNKKALRGRQRARGCGAKRK